MITIRFPTFLQIFTLIVALIAARAGYYSLSHGFTLEKVENYFPENAAKDVTPSHEELHDLEHICSQSFTYLAKGSQAYAFISEDKKYVLKLLKGYHLQKLPWLEKISLPSWLDSYRNEKILRRKRKLEKTLHSYHLAKDYLKKECGLIYLQILPSSHFHQMVTIYDRIGRKYSINLAQYGFMVQLKADLIFPTLSHFLKNNDLESCKKLLHSLVQVIKARSKKGIQDSDPDLHKNAACIGTQVIFIDVGGFHKNLKAKKPSIYQNDMHKITKDLSLWLSTKSPELAQYIEKEIVE